MATPLTSSSGSLRPGRMIRSAAREGGCSVSFSRAGDTRKSHDENEGDCWEVLKNLTT